MGREAKLEMLPLQDGDLKDTSANIESIKQDITDARKLDLLSFSKTVLLRTRCWPPMGRSEVAQDSYCTQSGLRSVSASSVSAAAARAAVPP